MKYEDEVMSVDIVARANLNYIEIPLTLKASHDLGDGIKMFGALGPYVGYSSLNLNTKTVSVSFAGVDIIIASPRFPQFLPASQRLFPWRKRG